MTRQCPSCGQVSVVEQHTIDGDTIWECLDEHCGYTTDLPPFVPRPVQDVNLP